MILRRWALFATSVAALLAGPPAVSAGNLSPAATSDPYMPAASLPAVSAINGKIGTFGGSIDTDLALGVFGSLAVPLGQRWGAQIDGMLGTAAGAFYGVGGHLFWRDPSKGLIGAYASYVGWGASKTVPLFGGLGYDVTGADVGKVGLEGEAYLGRVSLEGLAAYQYGTNSGFAGSATAAYYPTDDLRLDVSLRYLQGPGATGAAGVEWAPTRSGLSLFADAAVGGNSVWQVLGGAKWYFSAISKSLIRRHREDDPGNPLPLDVYQTAGDTYCLADVAHVSSFRPEVC